MKTIHSLLLASVVVALASCTHEVVYYRTKPRTVTTTVYRSSPTTLPGQAYQLPNPEAPSSFRAAGPN